MSNIKSSKIINYHISPTVFKNESRILKESKSLLNAGIVDKIKIIAFHSDTLPLYEKLGNNFELIRIRLFTKSLPKNLPFQLIKLTEFIFTILRVCVVENPKLITVHALWLLPLGAIIKFCFNAQLIYDAHELETETFVIKGFRKTLSKIVEKIFIKYVDLTLVVSKSIEDWYIKEYNIKNIVTVLNAPNLSVPYNSNIIRNKLKLDGNLKIILYLGGLVSGRGIEESLDAFAQLKKNNYCLVFLGYGYLDKYILEKTKLNKNIFLMSAVSPDEVLTYASSADIGIAFIENGSLNDYYCLPNKFFEYIFSGLPVIVNEAPEMVKIIRKYGIGDVIKKLDSYSLELSISRIESFNKSTLSESLKTAACDLSWENQEIMFLSSHRNLLHNKLIK
jgi:glycosyltransferase involved in cell wall biosynthesis